MDLVINGRVTSVELVPRGGVLSIAADTGDTVLTFETNVDFDESGGYIFLQRTAPLISQVMGYSAVDYDLGTVTLDDGLTDPIAVDTFVPIYPSSIESVATVVTGGGDEDEGDIWATVPAALRSYLVEGVRDEITQEAVTLRKVGEEYFIDDILGQQIGPNPEDIDLTGISIPGLTDGVPPAVSPTPTTVGGPGYIFAHWDGTGNHDPVTYEVHLDVTSGFAANATNLVGTIQGTTCFIRSLTDGTPLQYFVDPDADVQVPKLYYVVIVATDTDGAAPQSNESSCTMAQITSEDIVVQNLLAAFIAAGVIAGDIVEAGLLLANTIIFGDPDSQHGEMDGDQGLRLFDAQGIPLVSLPVKDGEAVQVNGEIIAQDLVITGSSRFRSADNTIEPGAVLSLAGKTSDPGNAPTVTITWSHIGLDVVLTPTGLAYSAAGGPNQNTPSFLVSDLSNVYEMAYDGSGTMRHKSYTFATQKVYGVAVLGDFTYVLLNTNIQVGGPTGGSWILQKWDTDWALLASTDITNRINSSYPGLGQDGTNVVVVTASATSGARRFRLLRFNPGTLGFTNQADLDAAATFNTDRRMHGYVYVPVGLEGANAHHYIATGGATDGSGGVWAFDGASGGARQAIRDFQGHGGGLAYGLTHDGTVMYSGRETAQSITKHSDWRWTTESAVYWVGYTWANGTGPTNETRISPRTKLTMQRRAFMRVTAPPLPPAADRVRVYSQRSNTTPVNSGSPSRFPGLFQGVSAANTIIVNLSNVDLSGTPPENPGSNNFSAAGTPGEIDATDGIVVIPTASSDPTGIKEGQVYQRSTDGVWRRYHSGSWGNV